MNRSLITGITGQDGAYLTEYLLIKNYLVHEIIRKARKSNIYRINHLYKLE